MKLYEVSQAYRQLAEFVETGDDWKSAMDTLEDVFDAKVESIAKIIRELEADAKAYEEEAKRLNGHTQAARNRIAHLKEYILYNMIAAGKTKVGEIVKVSVQPSPPSCEVVDAEQVPLELWRVIPERREVDKKGILELWKESGEVPPGVTIHSDEKHLRIW